MMQATGGLSEYELMIQKNIEERKKVFEMLKLGEAKKDLKDVMAKPVAIKRKGDEAKKNTSSEADEEYVMISLFIILFHLFYFYLLFMVKDLMVLNQK